MPAAGDISITLRGEFLIFYLPEAIKPFGDLFLHCTGV
jgi:hypothetical protein